MGAAVLCRQNFLPLAPLAALLLGDRKRTWIGFWFLFPVAAYGAFLLAAGALPAAIRQLGAQAGLQQAAFGVFFRHPWTLAGVLVGECAVLLRMRASGGRSGWVAEAMGWASVAAAASTLPSAGSGFLELGSFGLFGVALGIALGSALAGRSEAAEARFATIALLVAWCASISIGLNTPVLAAGILALVPLVVLTQRDRPKPIRPARSATGTVLRLVVTVALCLIWINARLRVIYRDRPAAELTQRLDGVLPGGAGVRTNPETQALMSDLNRAVALAGERPYAIVADFAGYWVAAPQRNPLSIDWAQSVELSTPALRTQIERELAAFRGRGWVIVQKFEAGSAAVGARPLPAGQYYFVPAYVRTHFQRVRETAYFELYR